MEPGMSWIWGMGLWGVLSTVLSISVFPGLLRDRVTPDPVNLERDGTDGDNSWERSPVTVADDPRHATTPKSLPPPPLLPTDARRRQRPQSSPATGTVEPLE